MKALPEIVKLQLENIELKANVLKSKFAELQAQEKTILNDLAESENIPFEKLAIKDGSFFNIEEAQNANKQPVQEQGRIRKVSKRS